MSNLAFLLVGLYGLLRLLGAAISQRVGQNAARVALAVLFELGAISVVYWKISGDRCTCCCSSAAWRR